MRTYLIQGRALYVMEIAQSTNNPFQEYIKSNKDISAFKELLTKYLEEYFIPNYQESDFTIDFKLFSDPDTGREKPMVEISLETRKPRDQVQHEFLTQLKQFLVMTAKDESEFLNFRKQQRKFMYIFHLK